MSSAQRNAAPGKLAATSSDGPTGRGKSTSSSGNWMSEAAAQGAHESSTVIEAPPDAASNQPVERPSEKDFHEISGLLKVKTSMLALGACERVKRLCRAFPRDVCESGVVVDLINILQEGPGTPLAAAALEALTALALTPEGRQRVVLLGAATPVVKLVARCDLTRPNTTRAVQLVMNLAADAQNRRVIREAGGVEALVALMRVAPIDNTMEQAMGGLHNLLLTDTKAKNRAVTAGIAYGLARVLASRQDEGKPIALRCRMLLADLLSVPDLQQRIMDAANELHLRIPGLTPARRDVGARRSAEVDRASTGAAGSASGTGAGPAPEGGASDEPDVNTTQRV